MLKTKTKKELQEIKDLGLYDDLCKLSDLLNIGYVSPKVREYLGGYGTIWDAYEKPSHYKINAYSELITLYSTTDGVIYEKPVTVISKNSNKFVTNTVICYKGKRYLIKDTADYRYLYLY